MKRLLRTLFYASVIAVSVFTMQVPAAVSATTTYFGAKSSDGYLQKINANANIITAWTGSQAAANADSVNATGNSAVANVGGIYDGANYTFLNRRGGLIFDTSALPNDAIITAASIQLYVTNKYTDMTASTDIQIQVSESPYVTPHDPLAVGDYNTTNYVSDAGQLALSSINTNAYNTWTLTAAGRAAISKTGVSKFVVREETYDINGSLPGYGVGGAQKWQGIVYYTQEAGSSYYPVLNVTYRTPAAPTITADAASSITDDIATLNGTIDDDGGYPDAVSIKWGWGTTSQTEANFASYTNVDANFAGTYSTDDTVSKNITGLDAGTTYYYRFQAENATGTTTSNEVSFTTLDTPTITSKPASNIAQTTARLNGQINNSGGEANEIRWGYGTSSQLAENFATYDTVTTWGGSYDTGALPFLDIATLTPATPYYFRFQARNSIGTVTSGELDFTTETTVGTPSNLIGIPSVTTIDLSWTGGTGATQYMIRTKAGEFPATTTDGSLIYFGTGLTFEVTGLTSGTTYYFSIWGESGGTFSTSYDTCLVTTNAGADISDGGIIISAPWRWMSAPNYTNLANLPVVYDAVNGVADSIQMPRATFWMLLALFTSALGGIMSYVGAGQSGRGTSSQAIGMIVGVVLLSVWWAMQIVPSYIIALDLLFTVLLVRSKREMD